MLAELKKLFCRHKYEAVYCDSPGWEFEQCSKCGHLSTLQRPGGTITIYTTNSPYSPTERDHAAT